MRLIRPLGWYSLVLTLCLPLDVAAAVVDAPNHPRGLGRNAILDDATQLLWMDLNYTLGQSYNSIVAQTLAGETFAGWRVATNVEVAALFQHVGLRLVGPGAGLGPEPPGTFLLENWRGALNNQTFNGINGSQANFATSDMTIRNGERDFSFYFVSPNRGAIGEVAVSTVLPDTGYFHIATALVRSAVPEPSAIAMAACCSIAALRRRRSLVTRRVIDSN